MVVAEKEGDLPVFYTDILSTFFLTTVEITARLTGKICTHIPTTEGVRGYSFQQRH